MIMIQNTKKITLAGTHYKDPSSSYNGLFMCFFYYMNAKAVFNSKFFTWILLIEVGRYQFNHQKKAIEENFPLPLEWLVMAKKCCLFFIYFLFMFSLGSMHANIKNSLISLNSLSESFSSELLLVTYIIKTDSKEKTFSHISHDTINTWLAVNRTLCDIKKLKSLSFISKTSPRNMVQYENLDEKKCKGKEKE